MRHPIIGKPVVPLVSVQYMERLTNLNPTVAENFSSIGEMFFRMAAQNPARILPGNFAFIEKDLWRN
jgi:hypothetical protein